MDYQQFVNVLGYSALPAGFALLIFVLAVWSAVWKGIALWKAARNGSKVWYVVMLVVNTAGILEIIYIFFFSKKNQTNQQ
jgi:hypothetical protein